MFISPFEKGVVGQALHHKRLELHTVNPRKYTSDNYHSVDDRPFGGGDGMCMLAEPLRECLIDIQGETCEDAAPVIYLTPQGRPLTQAKVQEFSQNKHLILLCGRYGGVDQRFIAEHVDEEISVGDYILSGGELAAMVVVDAVARMIPGVLGNQESYEKESFMQGPYFEGPLYTRPAEWRGAAVPPVLLSGDHGKIEVWRRRAGQLKTLLVRPDLATGMSGGDRRELEAFLAALSSEEKRQLGFADANEALLIQRLRGPS